MAGLPVCVCFCSDDKGGGVTEGKVVINVGHSRGDEWLTVSSDTRPQCVRISVRLSVLLD